MHVRVTRGKGKVFRDWMEDPGNVRTRDGDVRGLRGRGAEGQREVAGQRGTRACTRARGHLSGLAEVPVTLP